MSQKCFILMPFGGLFDEYYKDILVPAIKGANYEPTRADEVYGTKPIVDDIFREIRQASALVADVTGKNPNVNYELGIAHALNKQVVIITQSIEDIPFDYRHVRAIIYDTKRVNWQPDLSNRITNTLLSVSLEASLPDSSLGIKHIYKDRIEIKFLDFIRAVKAGETIRLLGIILTDFTSRGIQGAIEEKLQLGCKVKLLLLSPNSRFARQRAIEEGRDPEEWEDELIAVNKSHQNFLRRLPKGLRQNIELGHYDSPPSFSIYEMGDKVIIGFYLIGHKGELSPHFELEVREGGMYKPFINHFDSLWRAREEARSDLKNSAPRAEDTENTLRSDAKNTLITVEDESGMPIQAAKILLISEKGTYLKGTTDLRGKTSINRRYKGVTVFCAHEEFAPFLQEDFDAAEIVIKLKRNTNSGSVIAPKGQVYIPGLEGRLNPILDNFNRLYLYADNIAIAGGIQQPVTFKLHDPVELEDKNGNIFTVEFIAAIGKSFLIEFKKGKNDAITE